MPSGIRLFIHIRITMITRFELKNIALVDYAEIDFTSGVNILSGETGSGKSVILDSINFVLGAKADKTMIRYGTDECFASVTFSLEENHPVHEMLRDLGIDEDTLIISRKYSLDGKGSIKANGLSLTVNMLKKITSRLVDVHGQSEHFSLLKEEEQLSVIDNYDALTISSIKEEVSPIIAEYDEVSAEIRKLGGNERERAVRLDILKFQINEIENADLSANEEDELLKRSAFIKNAEKIVAGLNAAYGCLSEENAALDGVNNAESSISPISSYDEDIEKLYSRLDSAAIELQDISDTIKEKLDNFDFDENEAEKVEERLDLIKKLKKKYGRTLAEVLEYKQNAEEEYDKISHFDELGKELTEKKEALRASIYKLFVKLHKARESAASEFSKNIMTELRELGMPKACFSVKFAELPLEEDMNEQLTADGLDAVEFMFSANLGEPEKPLAKIVSGGEISRFMLAVRTQTAKAQSIPTFIFDEIDSGISGEIASVVAKKFAKIAKDKQILAITHLPQIACMADNSLLIKKIEENGKTKTIVTNLPDEERVKEITRLVGGSMSSKAAVEHATEMIASAIEYKNMLK